LPMNRAAAMTQPGHRFARMTLEGLSRALDVLSSPLAARRARFLLHPGPDRGI
jgi:hypothetical protein